MKKMKKMQYLKVSSAGGKSALFEHATSGRFSSLLAATGVGIRKDAEGRRNRHEDRIRQSY